MKSKVDFENDLPDLINKVKDGKIKQSWIEQNYDVSKATISRRFSNNKSKESKNVSQKRETFHETNETKKVPKTEEKKRRRSTNNTITKTIEQEKELIEHKALSEYHAISKLAESYKKHFGNKGIRITGRLQRYINKPKDMIRMSIILKKDSD